MLEEKSSSPCEANPKEDSCSPSGGEDVSGDHQPGRHCEEHGQGVSEEFPWGQIGAHRPVYGMQHRQESAHDHTTEAHGRHHHSVAMPEASPGQLGGGSGSPTVMAGELVANGTVTSLPLYPWIVLTVFALLARSRRWWGTLSVVVLCLLGALFRLRKVGRGIRSAHAVRSSRGAYRSRRGVRRAGPGSEAIGSRGSDRQGAGEAAALACALAQASRP
jgi:hypothetical protein